MHISSRSVNKYVCHRQFLFLIGRFLKKSSTLKPLCQMNRNLVGSFYGSSSINIAHFVLIRLQTWLPQAILVSDWSISKKSSPMKLFGQMNQNLVGSIYGRSSLNDCLFCRDLLANMATIGSSFFWLFLKNLLWNRLAKWTEIW